jgi:PilZ domain
LLRKNELPSLPLSGPVPISKGIEKYILPSIFLSKGFTYAAPSTSQAKTILVTQPGSCRKTTLDYQGWWALDQETSLGFPERRKTTRFNGNLPVELGHGRGVTRDFSSQGVYFETDQPLSVGEAIQFNIPIDHSGLEYSFHIRCQGVVLRVEPSGEKVGVPVAIHSYSFEEGRSSGTV